MNAIASSSKSPAAPLLAASLPQSESAVQNTSFESSDSTLVERCRAGDWSAFDALVERHQSRIFNVCYWMLGNRDEAADASQDAFVRAFRSLANFRGDSAFGTWLHRIAVNVAIDSAARRKKAPLAYSDLKSGGDGDDARDDPEPDPNTGPSLDPAQLVMREERRAAVRNALADLAPHYRVVLVLFDIEGYAYEEIAHTLDVPVGTVKSRINRARLALRDRLQSSRELFED